MLNQFAYQLGIVIGKVIRSLVPQAVRDQMLADLECEKERGRLDEIRRNWKTTIGIGVIGAKDEFAFQGIAMRPSKDSEKMTSDELFNHLAQHAAGVRLDEIARTGDHPPTMRVWGAMSCSNRKLRVSTVMVFHEIPDDDERVNVIHPAAERQRWQHVDRAMKCFLN